MEKYDFIIIGTGAGGGTMAYKLAQAGKKILILERGDFMPTEKENKDPHEVYTLGRYRTKETWKSGEGETIEPFTHYWVGGNTKMYGSALLRMRESDFENVEHYDGISPEWPLKYNHFEKYYSEAEHLYQVHGARGVDPLDPPASKDFLHPAIPHEPGVKVVVEKLEGLGLTPSPLPVGLNTSNPNPLEIEEFDEGKFDGYPDPVGIKADSQVIVIEKILALDNVTLITKAHVDSLETSEDGKTITGVAATVDGEKITYSGEKVIVSCGAINSAALLLRSKSDAHPNGLANSSDQVGRNVMLHNNGVVVAIANFDYEAKFQKTFYVPDFYRASKWSDYPMGTIQMMGKTDPDSLEASLKSSFPDEDLESLSKRTLDFFITAEDLPSEKNRVMIDEEGGIILDYNANNMTAYNKLKDKMVEIISQIDCDVCSHKDTVYTSYKLGNSGVSHQSGTCKFGTDPKTSVLDLNCKAHDVDNLYVIDSSFFCSSSAVNPSLTTIANALRVSETLLS